MSYWFPTHQTPFILKSHEINILRASLTECVGVGEYLAENRRYIFTNAYSGLERKFLEKTLSELGVCLKNMRALRLSDQKQQEDAKYSK